MQVTLGQEIRRGEHACACARADGLALHAHLSPFHSRTPLDHSFIVLANETENFGKRNKLGFMYKCGFFVGCCVLAAVLFTSGWYDDGDGTNVQRYEGISASASMLMESERKSGEVSMGG